MSTFQDKDVQGPSSSQASPQTSRPGGIFDFLGFVDNDPANPKSTLTRTQTLPQSASEVSIRGPLASLYKTKHTLDTFQYPSDLGTGPYQSWITFNVLESVQTGGKRPTNISELGGVTNAPVSQGGFGGGSAQNAVSLYTDAIDKAFGGTSIDQALKTFGVNIKGFSVSQKVRKTKTSISLYVPSTVVFAQRNDYSEISLTQALGPALAAAGVVQGAQGNLAEGLKQAAPIIAEMAVGGENLNTLLYGIGGTVLNPQIMMVYQKTSQRTFQFDFVMAARTRKEAEDIHNIINQFRFHAAPRFAAEGSGRYLVPPSEFDIQFMFAGGPHAMIPRISTCVITGVDVDYAPSGNFTIHDESSGRPTSVRMQLQFTEVDLITQDKVAIGY